MSFDTIALWVGFNLFVLLLLAIDLGVFHRHAHAVSLKEALAWSAVWITLALLFNAGVYYFRGSETALEFFTGYLIEKSLSVDNLFVFVLIFSTFSVPAASQHRVLFWGILGALVMRGTLILVGAALLEQFHWILYLFGAFLVLTGIRIAIHPDDEPHPEKNPLLALLRRFLPLSTHYEKDRFFVRHGGKLLATPLLLVLVVVESTDLVFAVDSIPAIFGVTQDPFVVYTSNVFAILGLRALYFVFAGVANKLYYLKLGLGAILTFVGVKMLIADFIKIPIGVSLAVIAILLAIAVGASVLRARSGMASQEEL
ncbi:MAG: TerC family protein [Chloroflexi bacterium]|nr:TerC family protein [Chloroflexota bacterium]